MKCSHCNAELSPGASFCGECGQEVPTVELRYAACGDCGVLLTPGARFCGECGQPVPPAQAGDVATAAQRGQAAPEAPVGYAAPSAQRGQSAPPVPPGYVSRPAAASSRGPLWLVILVAVLILLLGVALAAGLLGGDRLAGLVSRPGSAATSQPAVTVVTPPPPATPVVIVVTSEPALPTATYPSVAADTPSPTNTPLPTPTPQPTDTSLPTPTPLPTYTPLPTHTPLPTYTLPPTVTPLPPPTALPAPTQRPEPTATQVPLPELSVTYRDFHYECRLNEVWTRGRPPYGDTYGERSFQALMVITNQTTDKTLEPLWRPDRWIVTDGSTEWEETYAWQYGTREGGVVKTYPQPPIVPGDTQSWTWVCYPMPREAWVKAVEFTAWGQTYRFEFPKPAPGEFNYVNCP